MIRPRRSPVHRPTALLAAALVGLLAVAPTISAPVAPQAEPDPAGSVFEIAEAGLSVTMPEDATVRTEAAAIGQSIVAIDRAQPPGWSIRLTVIASRDSAPTAATELDRLVAQRQSANPDLRVLDRTRRIVSGRRAEVVSLAEPDLDGVERCVAWACIELDAPKMVVIAARSGDTTPDRLTRRIDQVLDAIRIRPPEVVAAMRSIRLESGGDLLEALDRTQLESLVGRSQWYRTYRYDESGRPREVGCMFVEVVEGPRGMVDLDRDPSDYTRPERERGFAVRVLGHYPVNRDVVQNSVAVHWMSWDQTSETWSQLVTVTDGRRRQSEAVTGTRTPRTASSPAGNIMLIDAGASRHPYRWPTPDVYLSQPLRWLLPDLLVALEMPAANYAWYCVDAFDGRYSLSYREDSWLRTPDGRWQLSSRRRPNDPLVVSVHDANGRLIERRTDAGTITEPATLASIRERWHQAGLPTGELRRRDRRDRSRGR